MSDGVVHPPGDGHGVGVLGACAHDQAVEVGDAPQQHLHPLAALSIVMAIITMAMATTMPLLATTTTTTTTTTTVYVDALLSESGDDSTSQLVSIHWYDVVTTATSGVTTGANSGVTSGALMMMISMTMIMLLQ